MNYRCLQGGLQGRWLYNEYCHGGGDELGLSLNSKLPKLAAQWW